MKSELRDLILTEALILIMLFTGTFPTWADVIIVVLLVVQVVIAGNRVRNKWKETPVK
jgi:hypothetical protein